MAPVPPANSLCPDHGVNGGLKVRRVAGGLKVLHLFLPQTRSAVTYTVSAADTTHCAQMLNVRHFTSSDLDPPTAPNQAFFERADCTNWSPTSPISGVFCLPHPFPVVTAVCDIKTYVARARENRLPPTSPRGSWPCCGSVKLWGRAGSRRVFRAINAKNQKFF